MSTNHNRIRVADLETNQPNKILKTNAKGELEFSDASAIETDANNVKLTGNQTIRDEKVFSTTKGNPSLNATVSLSGTSATNFSSVNDGLALYVAGFNNKKEIARIISVDGSATALNLYNQNSATGDFLKAINPNNNIVSKIDKDGTITAKSFIKTGGTNEQFLMADGSVKSIQTEGYNALDCTTEGKTLDARQGKALKDMIDNNTVNFASDSETQISTAVPEDKKVVSRLKLFNWWQWIKSQAQTVSGMWNFTNKITLASGTNTTPPLVIPNGSLTFSPQNGSIERDNYGKLWTSRNGTRYPLLEDDGSSLLLAYNSPSSVTAEIYSGVNASNSVQTIASQTGTFPNNGFLSIKMFNRISLAKNAGTVMPNTVKLEVFMQINNGFFYKTIGGPRWNQLKIYDKSNLSIPNGNNTTFYDAVFSEIIETSFQSWSGITLPLKTDNGSSTITEYIDYSLTNPTNDAPLPASQASFNFVFKVTLGYADGTNSSGQNVSWKIKNLNKALYIEKIK